MSAPAPLSSSGVNYDEIDPFKVHAQQRARETALQFGRFGLVPYEDSRGESAYLMRDGDHYVASVTEGLGTKNLVADAYDLMMGTTSYFAIGVCSAATILNDIVTLGTLPHTVCMHLALGDEAWLGNAPRATALVDGWAHACRLAGAVWGGGETSVLKGIVLPETAVIGGSATGRTKDLYVFDEHHMQPGDAIVFLESSGIHANGLTKCRSIAAAHPDGYLAKLADGRTFGQSLLTATHIYVPAVAACIERGIRVRYAMNMTGHGWLKLMRAKRALRYVIDTMPAERATFPFIQEHAQLTDEQMYCAYNMGVGFVLIIHPEDVPAFERLARESGWPFRAFVAGRVERGERCVNIEPLGMELPGSLLNLR